MMTAEQRTEIAQKYLLLGIQHWGQSEHERQKATNAYLEAAGFRPGEGHEWLADIHQNLVRGKFEHELDQLVAALRKSG